MPISQAMCSSFKSEVLRALHNFSASGGNVFYMALYTASASIGPDTTVYTTTNEISGTGYTAGGIALTNVEPVTSGTTGMASFANPAWPGASFTARGALIYNSTNGNRAVAVLDFGSDKTAANQTFTVTIPAYAATTAIVRIA